MSDDERMRYAIQRWVKARQAAYADRRAASAAYSQADERLLAAFAAEWQPPNARVFASAYQGFRAALIAYVEDSRSD